MVAAPPGTPAGATPSLTQPMAEILVIAAHPQIEHSHATRALMAAAARADPARVALRDLYALYPDYFIDTAAEQALLAQARLLVWLRMWDEKAVRFMGNLWLRQSLTGNFKPTTFGS